MPNRGEGVYRITLFASRMKNPPDIGVSGGQDFTHKLKNCFSRLIFVLLHVNLRKVCADVNAFWILPTSAVWLPHRYGICTRFRRRRDNVPKEVPPKRHTRFEMGQCNCCTG